ncbi:TPA: proline racemase family protein, partial [Raoultella ornithinolytica]
DAGIIPTIRGEAWVCGDTRLILNPDDPFCWGIVS